jgi:type III secretory pathway component EscV
MFVVINNFNFSMKYFFSIFFLLIMLTSVTVSVMEQWQGEDVSEVKESKANESDDADGEEKLEKEKEVYTFNHHILIEMSSFSTRKLKKTNHYGKDSFISELYASLPELPPEA